jgi:hypothetical protein
MLEIKSTIREMKDFLDGLMSGQTWLRKKPLSLRLSQWKTPKLKSR